MAFCMRQNAEEYYKDHYDTGVYVCADCGYELFSSRSKFPHHSEWPAFSTTVHEDSVSKVPEEGRPGALRVSCGKCGLSLGHEFQNEGPDAEKKLSRF